MNIKVTIDVIRPVTGSIYSVLKERLGREPTNAELKAEVKRIMESVK